MRNLSIHKSQLVLVIAGSVIMGLSTLLASPVLSKNALFLAALPMAAVLFLAMVLNLRHMFIFIIMTRAFLDPILEKTKIGGGGGIGGLLNLFVVVMVILVIAKQPKVLAKNPLRLLWIAFLGMAALAALHSPMRGSAIKLFLNLTTYACMFVAPFFIVKDSRDKQFWTRLFLISSFVPVAMANVGIVTHHPRLFAFDRLCGTFTHSNILAFYCVLMIVVVLYLLRVRPLPLKQVWRGFLWLYLVNLTLILVVTQTRSAWMSFAAVILIYGLLKDKKMLFMFMLGLVVLIMLPPVQERLQDLQKGTGVRRGEKLNSWAWRVRLWGDAMPWIQKNPVIGHGLGSFQYYSVQFSDLAGTTGAPAHNVYVELLFEMGLFGVLAYLLVYLKLLKMLSDRIKHTTGPPSKEAALLFSYIIGYLLVCVSDNALYYLAFNWYFWFFAGLIVRGWELE